MEGLKFIVSATVLALIVLAVALSKDARVAGESLFGERSSDVSLSEVIEMTKEGTNSIDVSSDLDLAIPEINQVNEGTLDDSSTTNKIDISVDSNVRVDSSVTGTVSGQSEATVNVDDQVITCPEGEDAEWEQGSTEVVCENSGNNFNFSVNSSNGSIKIKISD